MKIGKWLLKSTTARLLLGAAFLASALFIVSVRYPTPSFERVRGRFRPSDAWIVDRSGHPLESIRTRFESRSLDWVSWTEVSPAFTRLLIDAEDRRFFSHPGVDVLALSKALWERIHGRSHRGASTLTMQATSLIQGGALQRRRTWREKWEQMIFALFLNARWTKTQVLEAYINLAPFRGELVGLRAASVGFFGKNPSGLSDLDSALLVALLRAPNDDLESVTRRACRILKSESCQDLQALADRTLKRGYRLARPREVVPVLSERIKRTSDRPSLIQTSLDRRVQSMALSLLREHLKALKPQNVNDGAVLVLDTRTGEVLAYAANGGPGASTAEQVDGIQARRQAGSTIKPFVYATAFEWRLLRPESLIDDSPADIPIDHGRVYRPRNYDHVFRGLVSVADALGSSLNVPAVRALQLVGETRVLDRLRDLGFERLQDGEHYGPSLALGTVDVTLWELAHGYRRLAVGGGGFSDQTREWIFRILSAPEHRRHTFGTGSLLNLPFAAAVKTGTSKDMRDNWCVGWSDHYTVAVWVGNFNGSPMWNVSGISGAAPIWRSLMTALHPDFPAAQPAAAAFEPAEPLERRTLSRIRYPVQNMIVGLDPDIPREVQRLPVEIENPQAGHVIFLNNRRLASARDTVLVPIVRGKHRVDLRNESGRVVDSLRFEVR